MNFDRNTVIGFVLLAVLFFGFFFFSNKQQAEVLAEKRKKDSVTRAQDSIRNLNMVKNNPVPKDSPAVAAAPQADSTNPFGTAGTAQETVVENEVMRVVFSTKGGQPRRVELKKYKGPDSSLVKLSGTEFDRISYRVASKANQTTEASDVIFAQPQVVKNSDNSTTVTFRTIDGQSLEHQFVLRPENYMIDFNIRIRRADQLLNNNTVNLTWQNAAVRQQRDISYERQQSQIGYREDGDYDYSSAYGSSSEEFKDPVNWVSVKQQFFNTTLIAKKNFTSGSILWTAPPESDQNIVVKATATMQLKADNNAGTAEVPLQVYYGPTDYKILKQYGNDMDELVNLGSGIFSFVKWLNRWFVIPMFNLFSTFTSNYGIVILLLTLAIRLLISPLSYSSYLSGAKMKVLRPEIEQLKAKFGGDQQAMSMEQMKLFREAGVNPLGGCIPTLLQIPIFFALYSFFNSSVALRGQGFLWADDLSQYDSIAQLPFSIPFYGDHVSLFTITAVLTSFLISLYSMSMTPDQSNPVLKYMPYFFPIILLFIFNKLPSGLTWYYTASNVITLLLQFVIQNYIINHDRILAKMDENRKKPKTKSKWQERMEQMQEQQRQMQESRKKGGR